MKKNWRFGTSDALLLDTHAFLWWIDNDPNLPSKARTVILDSNQIIYVSMITAWEIAVKVSIGKLTDPGSVEMLLARDGLTALALTFDHIEAVKRLPLHHRDPFDRILIAQSLVEDLVLISNEVIFDAYGVKRIWE